MKPIYAVKKDNSIVAVFEEKRDAYKLKAAEQEESEDWFTVEKHILFKDLSGRERLR